MQRFDINCDQIVSELDRVSKAQTTLVSNTAFPFFLTMTLAVGNLMNQGNVKVANARGFKIWGPEGTLEKMQSVKVKDSQQTLLHFLLAECVAQQPHFAGLFRKDELEDFKGAASLCIDEITAFIKDLASGLKVLKETLDERGIPDGKFREVLGPFQRSALERLTGITMMRNQIENQLTEMVHAFGDDREKCNPKEIFTQLHRFGPRAHAVMTELAVEAAKEEKKREKAGYASPP
eukprot:TRINITY_DN432_c0_g1_i2.p3 TRINITY_DN432_c0_g1~~TRINITY_DN432_c0_g1_i2.p3  ORF type:complete len:235 (+),score=101.31 TRINITY_DN432_c0_g1_i2:972-1676(+)